LICQVCQATGWSWDVAEDQLTLPRLAALRRLWAQSPPSHLLLRAIARALGVRIEPAADPWKELQELAGDPASGIALAGTPPSQR
jgi:hypothetical protein